MTHSKQLVIQIGADEFALGFPENATLEAGNKTGVDIQIGDCFEDGEVFFVLRHLSGGAIQASSPGLYTILINDKPIKEEEYTFPINLQMPEIGLDCRLLLRQNLPDLPPLPDFLKDNSTLVEHFEQLPPIPEVSQRTRGKGRKSKQTIFARQPFAVASFAVGILLIVVGLVWVLKNEDNQDKSDPSKSSEQVKMPPDSIASISEKNDSASTKGLLGGNKSATARENGNVMSGKPSEALENTAEDANARGVALLKSDGSREEAFSLFEEAATANNPKALYNLALCYLKGIGSKINTEKAVELLKKASSLESPEAMLLLAELYSQGKGLPVDDAASLSLCEKAASRGSSDGMVALAIKLIRGQGTDKNIPKAIEWLEKASKLKNASAMNNLATLYARGQGVRKDMDKAKMLYRDAVSLGDDAAKSNLALIETGEETAIDKTADATNAKNVQDRDFTPTSQNLFKESFQTEEGKIGDQQSLRESKKVLDFGEAFSQANAGDAYAQAIISIYYSIGYKTQKDIEKAAEYAMKSAQQGHPLGIYRLGVMRQSGEGMEKNEAQGKKLRAQSVDGLNKMQGDPYALTALGVMLYRGDVLNENKAEAARVYKLAADQGYAPAQYSYAVCLDRGIGVEKNPELAVKYLDKSASQFYPPALEGMPK